MAIDGSLFESICPSRFLTFSFPTPGPNPLTVWREDFLRIAVLDSSWPPTDPENPRTAALLVPDGREHDWIFSTRHGQMQLLAGSPDISRLVLIGNLPRLDLDIRNATEARRSTGIIRNDDQRRVGLNKMHLHPLLLALCPKSSFRHGFPEIPFLVYEDDVFQSVTVDVCEGSIVGEMLVEDVDIEATETGKGPPRQQIERRRRLRFKRMPNLIQTQMLVNISADGRIQPDARVLVQPYLPPLVASLSLITPYLEEHIRSGLRPRVLCVGIGGGALLSFLRSQLRFLDILGVEVDEMVLRVARRYFGLVEDQFLRVYVGDGVKLIESFARKEICWSSLCDNSGHFNDVRQTPYSSCSSGIGIENMDITPNSVNFSYSGVGESNLNEKIGQCLHNARDQVERIENCSISRHLVHNSCEIDNGTEARRCLDGRDFDIDVIMVDLDPCETSCGNSAPPDFFHKSVLMTVRSALNGHGIFALNAFVAKNSSLYTSLLGAIREVFSECYEIDVGNGENYVLVGTTLPCRFIGVAGKSAVLEKLKGVLGNMYIDRLRKM